MLHLFIKKFCPLQGACYRIPLYGRRRQCCFLSGQTHLNWHRAANRIASCGAGEIICSTKRHTPPVYVTYIGLQAASTLDDSSVSSTASKQRATDAPVPWPRQTRCSLPDRAHSFVRLFVRVDCIAYRHKGCVVCMSRTLYR